MAPYFGFSDAADETNLKQYFVRSSVYEEVKKGKKKTGIFVVHGVKGAGKTAICNMLQMENEDKQLVLKIDKTFGFDVRDINANSAAFEGLMLTLLLAELVQTIEDHEDDFSSQAMKKAASSTTKFKAFISRIPSAIKVKAGPLELDPSKLLEHVAKFTRFDIGEYLDSLTPVLQEHQAYILLDDIDDVFAGADRNPDFVEGLLRAAKEINKVFGNMIHCVVFLKFGVFKLFFENAKEYDKLRDYISSSISWGKSELTRLLAVRIRQKHNKPAIEDGAAWALEFDAKSGLEKIQDYIVSRCISGPRDLIVYCNMAKERAGANKITMEDVEAVDDVYSKEKLATLNRDFGRTYPQISDFVQQLFSGEKQVYSNEALVKFLTERVISRATELKSVFKEAEYLQFATKERLIELLYSIGFIGFRRTKTSTLEFVITNPNPGSQVLYKAAEYRIHHAYKKYLNLTE